jgi:hypothetical protein
MTNYQIIENLEIHLLEHNSTLLCFNDELLQLKARCMLNGDHQLYKSTCKFLAAIKQMKKPETIIIGPSLAIILP